LLTFELAILGRSARAVARSSPSGHFVVPLLFRAASQQADNYHGHIVATHSAGIAIGSQAIVHQVFTDAVKLLLRNNAAPDEFDDSLRRLTVPDA
jgi:hypothetical protein